MKAKPSTSDKNILDVAVILDNDNTLRDVVATDSDFTIIVEPTSARQLFRLFGKWAKEGKKIRRLVLAGHGHWTEHHIGMILPMDFDLKAIRDKERNAYQNKLNAEKRVKDDEALLNTVGDEAARKVIQKRIDESKVEASSQEKSSDEFRKWEGELVGMEDVMAEGAVVGLINCCPAFDQGGRDFMNNISDVLLSKNGGRITGCTGIVTAVSVDSIWAGMVYWLHNGEWRYADDPVLLGEKWETYETPKSGKSHRRCGAPCKDFERYEFCDFPVKDAAPCFMHR